jgi:NAD(P)-dependent dehydrogenase (short-subunit alcohol dehydrogenase family)
MSGQTILITGASRGLGAATARTAVQMGANVVLMARSPGELEAVAQEIQAEGGQSLPLVGDVSKVSDCQRVVAETIRRFGQLDALVNNAGMLHPIAPIADAEPGDWERNWAVNLLGPVMLTQAALTHLRQRNGRVVNVSSGAAIHVIKGWAAYCAAKAALNHFTRALAEEEPSVTAIAFRPGVVDTAMQTLIREEGAQGMPEEVHARFLKYYQEGELLPPVVPACSLTVLSLYAPREWSGLFLSWNDEAVLSLVRRFASSPCLQQQEGASA